MPYLLEIWMIDFYEFAARDKGFRRCIFLTAGVEASLGNLALQEFGSPLFVESDNFVSSLNLVVHIGGT
jgi:hypothetical protein